MVYSSQIETLDARTPLARAAMAASTAAAGVRAPRRRLKSYSPGTFRKRLFDVVLAGATLAALAPALLAIWGLIRLTSNGPGLYWSERLGRDEKPFLMPKFRTMQMFAPTAPREALEDPDRHITPIGRVLRRWSLDELPQLMCVVAGDMSLVGPRPLISADPAQKARGEFAEAIAVRPGLTGLAQVRGRNFVSPRRKARLDALYARSRSGWFDVALIARTAIVLLTGRGFM